MTNTDSKALEDSVVPDRLQLGPGLGAGGRPETGRKLAEENLEKINTLFDENVKMVFITAGMGGGTGTGASPVIAREARKRGLLTVGVVTIPFLFELNKQIDKALDGLDLLAKEVDALLVINNQRLLDIYSHLTLIEAFKKADETLTTAVRSIVDIITMHGKMGLDFRDVHNVLKDGGVAVMSTGYGRGEGRLTKAIENALYSPLLNNNDIYRSRKIIISITNSSNPAYTLRMEEFGELHNFTSKFRTDIETKHGLTFLDEMNDEVKVTILASGFKLFKGDDEENDQNITPADEEEEYAKHLRRLSNYPEMEPNGKTRKVRRRPKVYLYPMEDLDNEDILEILEGTPTLQRSAECLSHVCALSAAQKQEQDLLASTTPTEQEEDMTSIDFTRA